jgi:hypothetical protein
MTTFSMLPDPIPYSESESLSLRWRFRFLVSRFLETFSGLSNFLLAQLRERLLHGIGFLSAFLSGAETGFLRSVFLKTTTIASIVGHVRAPMLLAQVAMLLGTYLFRDSETLSTRSFCTLLLAVRRFLVARRVGLVGSFLSTYALDCLEKLKERTHIGRSTTFLMKVVLILPRVGTHSENVTR